MERVEGIGGFFFRAKDPAALARWHETYLGVDPRSQRAWKRLLGPPKKA